jgi:hypothetical protein
MMSIKERVVGESADPRRDPETVLHSWDARVRVLSNPSAWAGVALSLGTGALGLGLLFIIISKSINGLYLAAGLFCGLMLIFMLVGGVIDLFGGFRIRFILTNNGVRSISGKGAKAAANTAIVGGILTGNLTGMAAGTLARSEQNVFTPYADVTTVKVNNRRQYITVKGGWAQKPIGLYCRNDDFTAILRLLKERCPQARFQ